MQIKSCSDNTLLQAFREGIKDMRLVWAITYKVLPTFAHLREITKKHAEADEYIRGWGLVPREQSRLRGRKPNKNVIDQNLPKKGKAVSTGVSRVGATPGPKTLVGRFRQYTPFVATAKNVPNQISDKVILRDPPPLQTDRARRNQNKYCNFHKDVGHKTKNCIQLRDQIELLVQDSHLQEFVEKIITPAGATNRTVLVQLF